MNIDKHTPGPWFASDMVGETDSIWIGNKDGYIAQVTREDGLTPQDWIDAALMSVAPELLDALKELLSATVDAHLFLVGDLSAEAERARERAMAVIAKTEGKTMDEILEDDES